jgi:hypothetical protein
MAAVHHTDGSGKSAISVGLNQAPSFAELTPLCSRRPANIIRLQERASFYDELASQMNDRLSYTEGIRDSIDRSARTKPMKRDQEPQRKRIRRPTAAFTITGPHGRSGGQLLPVRKQVIIRTGLPRTDS